jgi:hypothetical protein
VIHDAVLTARHLRAIPVVDHEDPRHGEPVLMSASLGIRPRRGNIRRPVSIQGYQPSSFA